MHTRVHSPCGPGDSTMAGDTVPCADIPNRKCLCNLLLGWVALTSAGKYAVGDGNGPVHPQLLRGSWGMLIWLWGWQRLRLGSLMPHYHRSMSPCAPASIPKPQSHPKGGGSIG